MNDLRFYVQKVLPLVYDDSLSYYEVMNKLVAKVNELVKFASDLDEDIKAQVEQTLHEWLESGELEEIIGDTFDKLKTRVDALDLAAAKLSNRLELLRMDGKDIVFFGDSWVVGGSAGATADRFSTRIANTFSMNEKNFGVGGATFVANPGNLISAQITTARAQMTEDARNLVPIVVLVGGVNDLNAMQSTTFSDFLAACGTTVSGIHDAFPNALIVACLCNTKLSGTTATMIEWITGAQERVLYHQNYPILVLKDCYNWMRNRPDWYVSDGLHLSTVGHGVFANYICQGLLGDSTPIFDRVGAITFNSTTTVLDGGSTVLWKEGSYINSPQIHVSFTSNITTNTLIGSIPAEMAPDANVYLPLAVANSIRGVFAIASNGGVYANVMPGTAEISGGYIPAGRWLAK